MMHYRKGENIESEIKKEDLPFDDCMPKGQADFLWMQVKGGTKVSNVLTFAKNALNNGEYRTIVWTGAGGGVVKTVSCAEILKRTHPMYQVTRMCYKNIEEHWLPQLEGLDEIVVNRQIPCIHILMSLDEIEDQLNVGEVQKPNTVSDFINPAKHPGVTQNYKNIRGGRRGFRGGQQRNQNQSRNDGEHRSGKKQYRTEGAEKQQRRPNQRQNQNQNQQETTPQTPKQSEEVEQRGAGNTNRKRYHRKPRPNRDLNGNSEATAKEQKSPATQRNQTKPDRMDV